MAHEPDRFAVICDGPRWWGVSSQRPDGVPVRLEKTRERASRAEEAALEVDGIAPAIDDLPAGCLIIHTAARGAATLFAQAADARGDLPIMAAPVWPDDAGEDSRNRALVEIAAGLVARGWKIKGLIAAADYDGLVVSPESEILEAALIEAEIFVRRVPPAVDEPEPEPTPDPGPPADPPPAADAPAEASVAQGS